MSRFNTFLRMSFQEKLAVAAVVPNVILVYVGLKVFSLARVAALLHISLAKQSSSVDLCKRLTEKEQARVRVAKSLFRSFPEEGRCLYRSLVIARTLRKRNPVVVIGVAKLDNTVHAHAWVEVDGISIDPSAGEGRFSALRQGGAREA